MTNAAILLQTAARRYPQRTALRYDGTTSTYAQLHRRAASLASGLATLGVRPGDRVGLVMANSPRMVESIFASLIGGYVVVPINARLTAREIAYIANNCAASTLIHDAAFDTALNAVAAQMPTVRVRISSESASALDYEQVVVASAPCAQLADVKAEDVAWLFYTSGTTGRPKGAIWTHRLILELAVRYLADVASVDADDVVLHIAPLSHGSVNGLFSAVAKAATTVLLPGRSFDPDQVFRVIRGEQVTNISFAAPTQLVKLVGSYRSGEHQLSSLRRIQYGGAPMYRDQLLDALKVFGPILVQIYGQAEVPMTITSLDIADHRTAPDGDEGDRLTSAGAPRTGMEVAVFDDAGTRLPDGQTGEICARGAMVTPGYWANPEASAATRYGPWWRTGDIGRVDEHGYLFLLDRANDMIVSGGNNVYPREVEDALLTHPHVTECAVFGIPDRYWGEAVHAVVALDLAGAVTAEELITFVGEHLAGYKKPKTIDFTDELPKNAYGKIVRRELREPFWADHGARVGGG